MKTVVTDSRHDRVELNHISHQSGQDGGRSTSTRESHGNHDKGGGEGLRDEPIKEVEKVSVTSRLQMMITRIKHRLQSKVNHPC